MNVLITGATGLVGRELITELLRHGMGIIALVRNPKSAAPKLGPKVKLFTWDGEKGPPPPKALTGVDAVVHLAGENIAGQRWSSRRKEQLRNSRILSAQNLRAGLNAQNIRLKVFVTASGIGYYGDRKDQKLSEKDGPGGDFLSQLCVEWEAEADQMPAQRIVKTRFGAVLAKGEGFLGKVVPLFKRLGASKLGDGKQWMTWIHIDDLVDVLHNALVDDRYSGPINAVAPEAVTNAEMTHELRKVLRTWPGPSAPRFGLRLLYGELADALLFSQKAAPKKLEELRFRFEHPKLREALHDLLVD